MHIYSLAHRSMASSLRTFQMEASLTVFESPCQSLSSSRSSFSYSLVCGDFFHSPPHDVMSPQQKKIQKNHPHLNHCTVFEISDRTVRNLLNRNNAHVAVNSDDSISDSSAEPPVHRHEFLAVSLGRCFLVLCCCSVAWIFPNFSLIVSLIGALSNSALAFVLPTLFYVQLVVQPKCQSTSLSPLLHQSDRSLRWLPTAVISHTRLLAFPMIIIVIGIIASIAGLYFTIHEIVD